MSNKETKSVLPYPPDGGLKKQVCHYDDTLSAMTVIKEHFFPRQFSLDLE